MQIELNLPEALVRKIKALHILSGGGTANFESQLVTLLDQVVSDNILEQLGMQTPSVVTLPTAPRQGAVVESVSSVEDDILGLSDGLGDADDSLDEALRADNPVDKGVKEAAEPTAFEQAMEEDLELEDPDHEGAADAESTRGLSGGPAENLFAAAAGLPTPPPEVMVASQVARREYRKKAAKTRRAKVSPLNYLPR